MKGVFKKNGYWIAKYGVQYLGTFKNKNEAENARNELETIYGVPTKSHPSTDLTGKVFGNLKVIGYSGNSDKSHQRKVIVRNLVTNIISEVGSGGLQAGKTNGRKRWENSSKIYGVRKRKDTGKWTAEFTFNHKRHYLGSFTTQAEAIAARKAAEEKYLNNGGN